MATTPFGPPLQTWPNKAAFYQAHPDLADGWQPEQHSGKAPLGWDLNHAEEWLVVFCGPHAMFHRVHPRGRGVVVAFHRESGVIHLIEQDCDFEDAKTRYQE